MQDNSNMVERFNERLEDVYCMNRKDVKALGTWIVTLPDELKDLSHDKQQEFFNETKNFLDERYGKEMLSLRLYTMTKQHHTYIMRLFLLPSMKRKID